MLAIGGASAGAVVFSRDDSTPTVAAPHKESTTTSTSTTSTTTTSTTTTTTTLPPEPEPAPAPQAAPAPQRSQQPQPAARQPAPEPAPAPAPPPPSCGGNPGGIPGGVLAAMNADRGGGLCWNGQLGGMAQGWANWMAANNSLSHNNLNALIGQTSFRRWARTSSSGRRA